MWLFFCWMPRFLGYWSAFFPNLVLSKALTVSVFLSLSFSFPSLFENYHPGPPFSFTFCRFINARRRIVQPMIDQSNRAGKSPIVTIFTSHRAKHLESVYPEASQMINTEQMLPFSNVQILKGCPLLYHH